MVWQAEGMDHIQTSKSSAVFDILSVIFLQVALNQDSGNWSGQFYIGMILLFFELKVSETVACGTM